jgi:hypothetical protein
MFQSEQGIEVTTGPNGADGSADLVTAVASHPTIAASADAVALVGYLQPAGSGAYRRLYRNPAAELFIDIRADDIVDRCTAAGDSDPVDGQSLIWVRRDADVVWHESMRASSFGKSPLGGYKWPRP